MRHPHKVLAAILFSMAQQPQFTPFYAEPSRPQFHFTAKKGWINDPNGLVYFSGEYHLFFQHNPYGTDWGNMTWGHAVSKDLVHWTQLDDAIEPDKMGMIFSGSAVVDEHNTSGFGKDGLAPMVCIYTAAGGASKASAGAQFTQCLAYSLDGRTFTKYKGNPVLPHQIVNNRDPKVIWYAPTKRWIMALYLDGHTYGFFSSPDLKHWSKLSEVTIPDAAECPDFFELPLDGDATRRKWVFWTAPGIYLVGTFDGATFKPETAPLKSNWGNTSYAAQTFFNDPKRRQVQIAWLQGSDFSDVFWNQQLGIPTELTLHTTPQGPRLFFAPVEELASLRKSALSTTTTPNEGEYRYASETGLFDVDLAFNPGPTGKLDFTVNGVDITYNAAKKQLTAFDTIHEKTVVVPLPPIDGLVQLRFFIDRASIEIFGQNGLVYMPFVTYPGHGSDQFLDLRAEGDGWRVDHMHVFELGSSWPGS
ncbi:MAG: glycoside hydrolase family 32 protein [Fimbriimonadaceae bacterium]